MDFPLEAEELAGWAGFFLLGAEGADTGAEEAEAADEEGTEQVTTERLPSESLTLTFTG